MRQRAKGAQSSSSAGSSAFLDLLFPEEFFVEYLPFRAAFYQLLRKRLEFLPDNLIYILPYLQFRNDRAFYLAPYGAFVLNQFYQALLHQTLEEYMTEMRYLVLGEHHRTRFL